MQNMTLTARPEASDDLFGEYSGVAIVGSVEVPNSPTIILLNGVLGFSDAAAFGQSLIDLTEEYEGKKWAAEAPSDKMPDVLQKNPESPVDIEEPGEVTLPVKDTPDAK